MGDSITASAISMARYLLQVFLGVQLFTLGSTGIWRDENAQLESATRCLQQSRVDMSNATAAASIWGQCVLCNFGGSNRAKANRIRRLIRHGNHEDAQYIVFVSNHGEGFSYAWNISSTTGLLSSDGTCGALVAWWANDNLITKTTCSSSKQSRMTTLMRYAALGGGSNIDVRDRLKRSIENFGYSYHYIGVASSGGSGLTTTQFYSESSSYSYCIGSGPSCSSCFVKFHGAQHTISVFIQ